MIPPGTGHPTDRATPTTPVAGTVTRLAVPSTQAVEGGDLVLVIGRR